MADTNSGDLQVARPFKLNRLLYALYFRQSPKRMITKFPPVTRYHIFFKEKLFAKILPEMKFKIPSIYTNLLAEFFYVPSPNLSLQSS